MADPKWRTKAACLDEDPELFWPAGYGSEWVAQVEEAKAVCRRCRVRRSCKAFAIAIGAREGIWGALTGPELDRARRKAGAR